MSKQKVLGIALVALCAVGAITASGASAMEWHWRHDEKNLTEPLAIYSEYTMSFEMSRVKAEFTCTMRNEGKAGLGAAGEITSITGSYLGGKYEKTMTCKLEHSGELQGICNNTMTLEATGLPWATELLEKEKSVYNVIKTSHGEAPGWSLHCSYNGESFKETCWPAASPLMSYGGPGTYTEAHYGGLVVGCTAGSLTMQGTERLNLVNGERLGIL